MLHSHCRCYRLQLQSSLQRVEEGNRALLMLVRCAEPHAWLVPKALASMLCVFFGGVLTAQGLPKTVQCTGVA